MKLLTPLCLLLAASLAMGQGATKSPVKPTLPPSVKAADPDVVNARLKDIARFRGVRDNVIQGVGIVVGLGGTGDTRKNVFTPDQIANLMQVYGQKFDPRAIDVKNAATVSVTATLPPFARNGQRIDITVSSLGDAKSLQGGVLLMTPLNAADDAQTIYAMAQGALTIGGFSVSAGGNQSAKGSSTTVARIPGGAIVERGAPTRVVDPSGRLFLELEEADITTASRVESAIREKLPEFNALALDGVTIELTLPKNMTPVQAMARIEDVRVDADLAAKVVINERTGTIVMGGDLKVGPASIAHGSLTLTIREDVFVSQPEPLSSGQTTVTKNQDVNVKEDPAKVQSLRNTTVGDLAAVFQKMGLSGTDIISILQALKQQGALKARVVSQ